MVPKVLSIFKSTTVLKTITRISMDNSVDEQQYILFIDLKKSNTWLL